MSLSAFLEAAAKPHTMCEYLVHSTYVRPFFDFDLEMTDPPSSGQLQTTLQKCTDAINSIFRGEPTFSFEDSVTIAHRHGFVKPKQVYKVSWRFWVKGFVILLEHMPALLSFYPQAQDIFDLSIYSKRRLMACIGGTKGSGDDRVLTCDNPEDSEWCLAQRLAGSEQLLDLTQQLQQTSYRSSSNYAPDDWAAVEQALVAAGFRNPTYLGRRPDSLTITADNLGEDCPCCPHVHESHNWFVTRTETGELKAKSYSSRCKMAAIPMLPPPDITPITNDTAITNKLQICLNHMGFPDIPDLVPGACFALKQHLATCPTCRGAHALESLYTIESFLPDCLTVRNEDTSCKSRILSIEHMVEKNELLGRILQNPRLDGPLADLYVATRGHNLVANEKQVFRFQEGRWSLYKTPDLDNDIRQFLESSVESLRKLLLHEEAMLIDMDPRANVKRLQQLRNKFQSAVDVGRQENKRKGILRTVITQLHDASLDARWDSNKDLLGLNNGCVDLAAGTFRANTKDDYLMMSCRYNWAETVDVSLEAEVEDFFAQVYPVEQERRLFQQWAGYCLRGEHNEKLIMLLTDRRSGFNAKSTVLSLISEAMGDYAIKADANLYYANDKHSTVNDHSAGLNSYQKKRLLFIEETASNRVLCSKTLKDYNGNKAKATGRGLYKPSIEEFDWTAKTIIAFNENRMPMVDTDDIALMERFIAVPHRSRFYATDVPDEPYSYPADTSIKDKFGAWRPYVLRWMLKGLELYHTHRFRNVPASCKNFMASIMEEKDTVRDFLLEHVEEAPDTDFIAVRELYKDYEEAFRDLQRDKKTKKSRQVFITGIERVLPGAFREQFNYYPAGKTAPRQQARSVVVGYKRRRA